MVRVVWRVSEDRWMFMEFVSWFEVKVVNVSPLDMSCFFHQLGESILLQVLRNFVVSACLVANIEVTTDHCCHVIVDQVY